MTITDFLSRLDEVRTRGTGKHLARCPSHSDKNPSLSIGEVGTRILVKCWAGCETSQIVESLGLTMADLFTDGPIFRGQRLIPKSQKLNFSALAYRFELAALDRRLKAERVLNAVASFSGDGMEDAQRDRLLKVVARAFGDQRRAEFLETVADDFRLKAFEERMKDHAA
jgi:hypothetical protein